MKEGPCCLLGAELHRSYTLRSTKSTGTGCGHIRNAVTRAARKGCMETKKTRDDKEERLKTIRVET